MDNLERVQKINFVKNFADELSAGRLYLVGGALRDYFLDLESNDFDFVVEGVGESNLLEYLEKFGKVIPVLGRSFGVIKFRPNDFDQSVDIALPRREEYLVGQRRKHAKVELEAVSIADDLSRRDFTINAMAADLLQIGKLKAESQKSKAIIDPFNGLGDLKSKIIRAVGDPEERFFEDPTRILRGIRFAVQFNFEIEHSTLAAMQNLVPEICKKFTDDQGREFERVAPEMIGIEFLKSLNADPVRTIELYDKVGVLNLLFPEVSATKGVMQPPQFHSEGDVFTHTLLALEALSKDTTTVVKLATLFHDIGKTRTFQSAEQTGDRIRFNNHDKVGAELARQILRRLRLPNDLVDDTSWLIDKHMKLPFSFPRMREDKQKKFARNRRFPELLELVCADAKASIYPDGTINDCDFLKPVLKVLAEIEAEKAAGKPVEILNGHEIIKILKTIDPGFDGAKNGQEVGAIKKRINSLYDRGKISSKEEAAGFVRDFFLEKTGHKK